MDLSGRRLYYNNSYLFEFESIIESVQKEKSYFEIILRESAFYPESGGQLADTGTLNDYDVIGVYVNDNDEVVHQCARWSGEIGQKLTGRINRERRLGNMRKHTGQHILSQAFLRVASAETVGAHLGETESTIELNVEDLSEKNLKEAELLSNDVIMENLPVKISYEKHEKLTELGVRRIPDRQGEFRLVGIGDFELTACGGTHCAFTGEIGMLKIIGLEKIRNRVRVTFLCGKEAGLDYCLKDEVINKLTRRFTCHFNNLDDSVQKLILQNENNRKQINKLNKELLPYHLEKLKSEAVKIADLEIIRKSFEDYDIKELRDFALNITKAANSIVLFDTEDKLIISASDGQKVSASEIAGIFVDNFEGRGGGNPVIAQVGNIPREKMEDYINSLVIQIEKKISGK